MNPQYREEIKNILSKIDVLISEATPIRDQGQEAFKKMSESGRITKLDMIVSDLESLVTHLEIAAEHAYHVVEDAYHVAENADRAGQE